MRLPPPLPLRLVVVTPLPLVVLEARSGGMALTGAGGPVDPDSEREQGRERDEEEERGEEEEEEDEEGTNAAPRPERGERVDFSLPFLERHPPGPPPPPPLVVGADSGLDSDSRLEPVMGSAAGCWAVEVSTPEMTPEHASELQEPGVYWVPAEEKPTTNWVPAG